LRGASTCSLRTPSVGSSSATYSSAAAPGSAASRGSAIDTCAARPGRVAGRPCGLGGLPVALVAIAGINDARTGAAVVVGGTSAAVVVHAFTDEASLGGWITVRDEVHGPGAGEGHVALEVGRWTGSISTATSRTCK
jgi:hypothetical protein